MDYNPDAEESIQCNKLHFSAHRHTAAEVIYESDAEKPFMGLNYFVGELLSIKDQCSEKLLK